MMLRVSRYYVLIRDAVCIEPSSVPFCDSELVGVKKLKVQPVRISFLNYHIRPRRGRFPFKCLVK